MSEQYQHRNLLLRAGVYERKYARLFRSILRDQYIKASEIYPNVYYPDPLDYKDTIEKLYNEVLPKEAKFAWDSYIKPLSKEKKDIIDDLISFLGMNMDEAQLITLWRDVSKIWLDIHILTKITGISETTAKAIAKVIENELNKEEGTSIENIKIAIVKESKGEVNKSRSMLIARTETMTALSKGRRLSMLSSPFEFKKKWVDTPDNRTRISHRYVASDGFKEFNEPYTLIMPKGGTEQAMHPSDPNLSAANSICCRCSEIYEVKRDASGRPIRKKGSVEIEEIALTI